MRPLRLRPHLVEKPWGGRRLEVLGRDLPEGVAIGESWDVADLAPDETAQGDAASRVDGGPHDGSTLHELIATDAEALLGTAVATPTGRFPLLVKHLDAAQHLSVQVHPPESLITGELGWAHKTESWVVVHADPGAVMFLGLRDGVTIADVRDAVGTPALVDLLRQVPAHIGDVHHLPAGLVHALGAGIVVAEVQTPSDTTFRLYDWAAEYGREPRELHTGPGLRAIEAGWDLNVAPRDVVEGDGVIVCTDHYVIHRRRHDEAASVDVPARPTGCVVIVLSGSVGGDDLAEDLGAGGCVVLPAAWAGTLETAADTVWLEAHLVPSDGAVRSDV